VVLNYTTRDLIITVVMGCAKQKEHERKWSAASCQQSFPEEEQGI